MIKQSKEVTTSLTIVDIHDIARSSATFGINTFFIAHPAEALKKLAEIMTKHWREGFGSTYNPKRKLRPSQELISVLILMR
ncbi:MAG: RNA methyltransferase [Bdellovibrionota bacterium]